MNTPDPGTSKQVQQIAAETAKAFQTIDQIVTGLASKMAKVAKTGKTIQDVWGDFSEEIENSSDQFDKLVDTAKKLSLRKQLPLATLKRVAKEAAVIKGRIKQLNEEIKEGGKDNKDILEKQIDLLKRVEGRYAQLQRRIEKGYDMKRIGSGLGTMGKMFKGVWGAWSRGDKAGLKNVIEDAQNVKNELGAAGTVAKNAGNKIMGGILKGTSGAIGGLMKVAGPAGAIGIFIKGVWDMAAAADQFVKDANKRFNRLRGPNIMTGDVRKQFKDFNDQLYDMRENLKVGLSANQVGEFVEAITSAGTHLDVINTGLRNYRDAVYVAAKASKTLGADMPAVAGMMSTLINEYKMSVSKIDDTFSMMGFDAQKAGLSTDTFWRAIENATSSLAFYGVGIETASRQVAAFQKAGVMGFKDVQETVTEYNQTFTKMNENQKAGFAGLMMSRGGGAKAGERTAKDFVDKWTAAAAAIEKKRAGLTGIEKPTEAVKAEIANLTDQLAAANTKIVLGQKAQMAFQKRDAITAGVYLSQMTDNSQELINTMLRNSAGVKSFVGLNGAQIRLLQSIAESSGISQDLIMKGIQLSTDQDQKLKDILGLDKSGKVMASNDKILGKILKLNEKDDKKGSKPFGSLLKSIKGLNVNSEAGIEESARIAGELQNMGIASGDQADLMAKALMLDARDGGNMIKQLDSLRQSSPKQKNFGDLLTGLSSSLGHVSDAIVDNQANIQSKSKEELGKNAEDTFKEIRTQTLSLKDAAEIAKDQAKWMATGLYYWANIDKGIANLVDIAARGKGPTLSQREATKSQQKIAKPLAASLGMSPADLLNPKTQANLVSKATGTVTTLSPEIAKKEKVVEALKGGGVGLTDALMDIQTRMETRAKQISDPTSFGLNAADVKNLQSQQSQDQDVAKRLEDIWGVYATKEQKNEMTRWKSLKPAQRKEKAEQEKHRKILSSVDGILSGEAKTQQGLLDIDLRKFKIADEQLKSLVALDETNAEMATLEKARIMGDEGTMKKLAEDFQNRVTAAGKTSATPTADVAEEMHLSDEMLSAMSKYVSPSIAGQIKGIQSGEYKPAMPLVTYLKPTPANKPTPAHAGEKTKQSKAGLKGVETLTKPTLAHAGEVLGQKNLVNALNNAIMPTGGAAGGGNTSKSISIQINAYSRDLAQQIRNEIYGALKVA